MHLNVLIFRDRDSWQAQCLEKDIRAHSFELAHIRLAFQSHLVLHLNDRSFYDLPTANQLYTDAWTAAAESAAKIPVGVDTVGDHTIQYRIGPRPQFN